MRIAFPALLLAALVAATAGVAHADPSPCDDAGFARDLRLRYPDEINKMQDIERKQQEAWAARAKTITDHVVEMGAATRDAENLTLQELYRNPAVAQADLRAHQAADDFRVRNSSLPFALPMARLDPLRPDRAWCLMAMDALQSLHDKLAAEIESWSLIDRGLLAAAASRGVQFAH